MKIYPMSENEEKLSTRQAHYYSTEAAKLKSDIAMKLRVIKSSMIYVEVVKRDVELLGYTDDGKTIIPNSKFHPRPASDWNALQDELNDFVAKNCFYNEEKPVPRIEKIGNGGLVFINERGQMEFSSSDIDDLHWLKVDFPSQMIYENKPRFTSEWKRVFPQTFHFTDFALPEDMESKFFTLSIEEGKTAAELMNRRISDTDVEIWDFTIWSK